LSEDVRIQEGDFSVEEEVTALRSVSKRIGGVVTFLGTARDFSEGREVRSIEFEQYAGMALSELEKLREEILESFDVIAVRIVHRVALIEPGEQIVLIVVGAEHRAEAFEACRYCIDELKRRVPLWKKEKTPDGEEWVTKHP
jgi:molybdopterin synthase catalytic subunit